MRKFLKWTAIVVGSLIGLILVGLVLVYFGTQASINETETLEVKAIPLHSDSATIANGRYLSTAIAKCVDCHGDNFGGKLFIDAPIGKLAGPNLTSGEGSVTRTMKDVDWVRAIRHGLAPDGRRLWVMPVDDYQHLSADEINAIVSYIKSLPPVNNTNTPRELTLLGRILVALGQIPLFGYDRIDHTQPIPLAPPPGLTLEYGRHMATTGGCTGCHGPELAGGPIPGAPPDWPAARNITPDAQTGIGSWSEADFTRALREGKRPNGTAIDSVMPWKYTRQLTDLDLKALYMYVRSVPAKHTDWK